MPVQHLAQCILDFSRCWKNITHLWSQLPKKVPYPNAQHLLSVKLKEKKSKDLIIIVNVLLCLKIISKHCLFCCALISCGLFNYSALLVTLPQNISIILQAWTRLCTLPSQTWDYYFAYFAVQETESQNFAPDKGYVNKHLGLETGKYPCKCCPGTDTHFPCFSQIYKYPNFVFWDESHSSTPLATKPLLYATSVCNSPGGVFFLITALSTLKLSLSLSRSRQCVVLHANRNTERSNHREHSVFWVCRVCE